VVIFKTLRIHLTTHNS